MIPLEITKTMKFEALLRTNVHATCGMCEGYFPLRNFDFQYWTPLDKGGVHGPENLKLVCANCVEVQKMRIEPKEMPGEVKSYKSWQAVVELHEWLMNNRATPSIEEELKSTLKVLQAAVAIVESSK